MKAGGPSLSIFAERVAAALEAEAPALVERWQVQARAVAPRVVGRRAGDGASAGVASPAVMEDVARRAVVALACALRRAPRCQDDALRAGWEFGGRAHARGTSLHYMMKELDLLEAMVLYVAEQTAQRGDRASSGRAIGGDDDREEAASGADVMGAARRLHRTFAAMRLAATKGFTHALVETLRGRYRTLRHDLRNPIGTIRSAIALMEDETLPADVRFGARYRAMVTRNAASLETLVAAALGDAQAHGPALTLQEVSLGELARTVRRDLRDDAEAAGCTIELAPSLVAATVPAVRADSTAFELVLRSLVDAALDEARRDSAVTVGLRALRDRTAVVTVSFAPAPRAADRAAPSVSALAVELAQRAGGRVWREDDATLLLEMPVEVRAAESVATAAVHFVVDEPPASVSDTGAGIGAGARRERSRDARNSFGADAADDAEARTMDQLPRGGGPPGDEVASSR
jgi:signal transduction histidine kinase